MMTNSSNLNWMKQSLLISSSFTNTHNVRPRARMIQSLSVQKSTDMFIMLFHTDDGDRRKKTTIPEPKLFVSNLTFIQLSKRLQHIDQPKTFTLKLKSKILDFETLCHVHVYRIEYISYRLLTVSSQPQSGQYWVCLKLD